MRFYPHVVHRPEQGWVASAAALLWHIPTVRAAVQTYTRYPEPPETHSIIETNDAWKAVVHYFHCWNSDIVPGAHTQTYIDSLTELMQSSHDPWEHIIRPVVEITSRITGTADIAINPTDVDDLILDPAGVLAPPTFAIVQPAPYRPGPSNTSLGDGTMTRIASVCRLAGETVFATQSYYAMDSPVHPIEAETDCMYVYDSTTEFIFDAPVPRRRSVADTHLFTLYGRFDSIEDHEQDEFAHA